MRGGVQRTSVRSLEAFVVWFTSVLFVFCSQPGQSVFELQGGVVGGTITRGQPRNHTTIPVLSGGSSSGLSSTGVLKVGQEVEIRPGIVRKGQPSLSYLFSPVLLLC